MTRREWRTQALGYILRARKWMESPYRMEREYARYVKRFLFGDGDIVFDGNNETWKIRERYQQLPMPVNAYLYE